MLEHSTWHVQRLKKPYKEEVETPLQALMKYELVATGLSSNAKEVLSGICVWDYMGASEYEFGAIPKALRSMVIRRLIAKVFPVPYHFKRWRDSKVFEGVKDIGIICKEEELQEVLSRIMRMAVGDPSIRCKESHEVDQSLAEYDYSKDVYGWLELDNGYMFFKDRKMFDNFCCMFDVSIKEN